MQSTVSRNGWTSPMKRSSRKDWFGVTRGEVCSASLRARAAHRPRCGHYTCRKENIATQREEYRASVTGSHYTTAACLERTPPVEWPTTPATDPRQDPWLQERVPTRRYLHKREWPNWLDVCRTVMLGYNASAPDERSRKQVAIMDLVRPTYDCRRNRVVVATPPAPTTTSSITPTLPSTISTTRPSGSCRAIGRPRTTRRARSAMRRATGPDGPPDRAHTYRVRHIQGETRRDTVHTAGNGTRSRAPHGGGGGAGGIFPRAGPKP
ncbi:putative SLACS retrotransposable element [Trypanosoma cruzi]|uniref:Putative SLACS retrotransposable element n=1 Tax=Trypanosoma cruzi TaxID=5693 RepID=A0A2V2UPC5_TRYCR|nr:putative SLACS retrotransposable element [Trypanosoma cruzi]